MSFETIKTIKQFDIMYYTNKLKLILNLNINKFQQTNEPQQVCKRRRQASYVHQIVQIIANSLAGSDVVGSAVIRKVHQLHHVHVRENNTADGAGFNV